MSHSQLPQWPVTRIAPRFGSQAAGEVLQAVELRPGHDRLRRGRPEPGHLAKNRPEVAGAASRQGLPPGVVVLGERPGDVGERPPPVAPRQGQRRPPGKPAQAAKHREGQRARRRQQHLE